MYVRFNWEIKPHLPNMISLNFLIKKDDVAKFQQSFQKTGNADVKYLLSGPWPPYNFVVNDKAGDMEKLFGDFTGLFPHEQKYG